MLPDLRRAHTFRWTREDADARPCAAWGVEGDERAVMVDVDFDDVPGTLVIVAVETAPHEVEIAAVYRDARALPFATFDVPYSQRVYLLLSPKQREQLAAIAADIQHDRRRRAA